MATRTIKWRDVPVGAVAKFQGVRFRMLGLLKYGEDRYVGVEFFNAKTGEVEGDGAIEVDRDALIEESELAKFAPGKFFEGREVGGSFSNEASSGQSIAPAEPVVRDRNGAVLRVGDLVRYAVNDE